eukprot:5042783-Ditylum_brightwellii.AAC.1
MIASGMKTTLVRFQDQYYNYKGVVNDKDEETNKGNNGLAIGAFESIICADKSALYTCKMCAKILNFLKLCELLPR